MIKADIKYADISESQKLDLHYKDAQVQKQLPLVMFIHGGGFSSGDKAKGKVVEFVKFNKDFVFASVNYRLSGERCFPAGIEDCQNALLYLIKNSKKYGIDATKVAIIGYSSGGNYALMLGLNEKLMQNFKKTCIVALYPVTDLFDLYQSAPSLEDKETKDYMVQNSELYFGKPFCQISAEQLKAASPYYMFTKNFPSTLLQHGTADDTSPLSQSQSFYDKAKALGVDITLDVIKGAGHGDKLFVTKDNLKRIFDYIRSKLDV